MKRAIDTKREREIYRGQSEKEKEKERDTGSGLKC